MNVSTQSFILFAMCINDLENLMSENNQNDMKNDHIFISVHVLVYIDIVLLNKSAKGLQALINTLYIFCNQWKRK